MATWRRNLWKSITPSKDAELVSIQSGSSSLKQIEIDVCRRAVPEKSLRFELAICSCDSASTHTDHIVIDFGVYNIRCRSLGRRIPHLFLSTSCPARHCTHLQLYLQRDRKLGVGKVHKVARAATLPALSCHDRLNSPRSPKTASCVNHICGRALRHGRGNVRTSGF